LSAGSFDPDEDIPLLDDASKLAGARKIVMWLDMTLDCQLALAWLPAFLRAVGSSLDHVELVQSELEPMSLDPFAKHAPPSRVSLEDLAELLRAWDGIVAPEPDGLLAALSLPFERLPFFKRALPPLRLRYPERISGVNEAELRVLDQSRPEPLKAARIIGEVLGELSGSPDVCHDDWLYHRILRLGDPKLPQPALELTGSTIAYRFVNIRITPFGERVLKGDANFVDANGIDDWIAGVHLESKASRVWYHDEGRLVPRRAL
jgi:hypothetical protein